MKISKEFAELFPKSTWSDEEIAEDMFTPYDEEDIKQNHRTDKGTLIIDKPLEEYVKKNNLIDLQDYLDKLRKMIH